MLSPLTAAQIENSQRACFPGKEYVGEQEGEGFNKPKLNRPTYVEVDKLPLIELFKFVLSLCFGDLFGDK